MLRTLLAASAIVLLAVTTAIAEGDLSKALEDAASNEPVKIDVACGNLDKGNCKLLPRIAVEAANRSVTVEPFKSLGSVESTRGVCQGVVQMAVVQRDAVDSLLKDPAGGCVGKLVVVGSPVYPYYGYLVVRADAAFDSIYELVDEVPSGGFASIAAGRVGSGGQVSFKNLLDSDPKLKAAVKIESADQSTALDMLQNQQIAGYFVMDGPKTDLVDELRKAVDAETKKPQFKFIDVNPWRNFFRDVKGWTGQPMFYEATIQIPGWFTSNVTTIATDAIAIANKPWAEEHAPALQAFRESLEIAAPAIRADLAVPADWGAR